jgi:beta-barrel assembly-enhancing protease
MKLFFGMGMSLCLAVSASAVPKVKTEPAPPPPPYAGIYQPQGVDEIGMWKEWDERERELVNSPLIIRDEALNTYIRKVLCNTVGQDRCNSTRTYIVRVPYFNASMAPNGTMLIHSGLLLRVRTEAELGAVLGHEFGHFEKRHQLEQFKAARKGTDILSWAAVLTSMSGSQQAYRNFDLLQLSVLGGLVRFGRNQEREADLVGLGYLNDGVYRPQAASRVWRNMILEAEASAAARGLKKPDFNRIAFFASHPPEGERADYLYVLATPNGDSRTEGSAEYQNAIAPWVTQFVDDQIATNDFGASEFIINKLGESGWTADLWRARGDLFRLRGNPRDLMNSTDFYGKAVALKPDLAEAQRGLGLSLVKTGRPTEGLAALEKYLQLKPDASDVAMITQTIALVGRKK